ncbi:MAG: hypothetical protein ACI9PU_001811, partial [Ascidiaceihabitans sp.]
TKLGNLKKADAQGCDPVFSMCKRSESRERAQSRRAKSQLRALAAGVILQVRAPRCYCAAVKSAIHARRGETNPTNPQIAARRDVLGSFSITATSVHAFNPLCFTAIFNAQAGHP